MAAELDPQNYKDVVLFLATAGIVAPLFRRLKISPILGFLGAGVVLGPFGLGAMAATVPWLGAFTIANPAEIAHKPAASLASSCLSVSAPLTIVAMIKTAGSLMWYFLIK